MGKVLAVWFDASTQKPSISPNTITNSVIGRVSDAATVLSIDYISATSSSPSAPGPGLSVGRVSVVSRLMRLNRYRRWRDTAGFAF
jgi:hypothetical protein